MPYFSQKTHFFQKNLYLCRSISGMWNRVKCKVEMNKETKDFYIQSLLAGRPAFGIVAPYAPERTPFEEQGGPDAGPVVEGVALEVEQESHGANLRFFCISLYFHCHRRLG